MYSDAKFERRRDARLSVDDLKDVSVESFIEIAKDKWKSRSLQRSLMESDEVVAKLIYAKAEPIFTQLLSDQYGNYLSQKILEYCTDEQFDLLFAKVETKLSNLANEVHGTRAVQKFVEEGVKRDRTEQILNALRDHVEPLSRSVTGFHVVVKLLEKLAKPYVEEILGKLCCDAAAVVSMGKDQWGCCVLKACIDTAEQPRLKIIVDAIVTHTLELVQDPYGNYVVQHVLASNTCFMQVLPQMIAALKDHVLDLCQQKFSSNVLEKLLTTAPEPHKQVLIQGVLTAGKLETSEVAQHLLFHQYGNYVLQQTLAVAKEPQHGTLLEAVRPYVHQVLRHLFEGDHTMPHHGATSLAPEQAQRLAMKLVKRFPALLEGLEEHEKAMLAGPSTPMWEQEGYGTEAWAGNVDPYMTAGFPFATSPAAFHGAAGNPYYQNLWNPSYNAAAMAQWAQYSQLLAMGRFGRKGAGKSGGGKYGTGPNGTGPNGNPGGKGGNNGANGGYPSKVPGGNPQLNPGLAAPPGGLSAGVAAPGGASNSTHASSNSGGSNTSASSAKSQQQQNGYQHYYMHAQKAAQALASLNALQQAAVASQALASQAHAAASNAVQAQAVHQQAQQVAAGSPPHHHAGGSPWTYPTAQRSYYETSPEEFWSNYYDGTEGAM